jgi:hypothetical protein
MKGRDYLENPGVDGRIILIIQSNRAHLVEDRTQWQDLVNIVMNLRFFIKEDNFLTSLRYYELLKKASSSYN